eukprot:scaffold12331_cov31-Tisochrysis_lutea.AAC.5
MPHSVPAAVVPCPVVSRPPGSGKLEPFKIVDKGGLVCGPAQRLLYRRCVWLGFNGTPESHVSAVPAACGWVWVPDDEPGADPRCALGRWREHLGVAEQSLKSARAAHAGRRTAGGQAPLVPSARLALPPPLPVPRPSLSRPLLHALYPFFSSPSHLCSTRRTNLL